MAEETSKEYRTSPGVLNFSKIRTSSDRLNFGEDDLENLVPYYWIVPYDLSRYNKVFIRYDVERYEEYKNTPRIVRISFRKEDKIVAKALSAAMRNEDILVEEILRIPDLTGKDYDETRLEVLVEKFEDGPPRFSNLRLYLAEEFIR